MLSFSEFEKQIKRIHEIVEQTGSHVIWNDHLTDPDNPDQARQIDISIKREDSLTLIECRLHQKKQDVKWIEELIGRKISLRADYIIAVSASGFTQGAIKKARAYGISLRDLLSLTEEEIRLWGKKTKVWLNFLKFNNLKIMITMSRSARGQIPSRDIIMEFQKNESMIYSIINSIASLVDENAITQPGLLKAVIDLPDYYILGHLVLNAKVTSHLCFVRQELMAPIVFAYDDPNVPAIKRDIKLEHITLGKTNIAHALDNVSIALDLSDIKPPESSIFMYLEMDMNRNVTAKVETIGLKAPSIRLIEIQFMISYE